MRFKHVRRYRRGSIRARLQRYRIARLRNARLRHRRRLYPKLFLQAAQYRRKLALERVLDKHFGYPLVQSLF